MEPEDALKLIAYRLFPATPQGITLVRAARDRAWMSSTPQQYAYRCLPLLIANQSGWFLVNQHPLEVVWSGDAGIPSLQLSSPDHSHPNAISHFGSGIMTIHVPFLFRTPPGWNLHVRGPANFPKDGVSYLEGVVETDWSPATFTHNIAITRPHVPIRFEVGEPLAMLAPVRRGELEAFHPEILPIAEAPELHAAHNVWSDSRSKFLRGQKNNLDAETAAEYAGQLKVGWQREYMAGREIGGMRPQEHQTKVQLREFLDLSQKMG